MVTKQMYAAKRCQVASPEKAVADFYSVFTGYLRVICIVYAEDFL
jgi:hypothetical protein